MYIEDMTAEEINRMPKLNIENGWIMNWPISGCFVAL